MAHLPPTDTRFQTGLRYLPMWFQRTEPDSRVLVRQAHQSGLAWTFPGKYWRRFLGWGQVAVEAGPTKWLGLEVHWGEYWRRCVGKAWSPSPDLYSTDS
eukprot:gene9647-7561_t